MAKNLFNQWQILCHADKTQKDLAKYMYEKLNQTFTQGRISEYKRGIRGVPKNVITMMATEYYPVYCKSTFELTDEQATALAEKMINDLKEE